MCLKLKRVKLLCVAFHCTEARVVRCCHPNRATLSEERENREKSLLPGFESIGAGMDCLWRELWRLVLSTVLRSGSKLVL